MERRGELLEQIVFNRGLKLEEHMLYVLDKSTHEEHLSQISQTNNKQFKIAVTFSNGFIGIFNITHKNNKLFFKLSYNDDDFNQGSFSSGAHEKESLNKEIKRFIIEEG